MPSPPIVPMQRVGTIINVFSCISYDPNTAVVLQTHCLLSFPNASL
jgi:hypothetical protein